MSAWRLTDSDGVIIGGGEGRTAFRRDVEGLRALAVLLVVGFHAGVSVLGGGFIGVDVFFVISGYLITGQLAAEYGRAKGIDLLDFWARRARRLLPAGALMLLAVLLASELLLAPSERAFVARAVLAAGAYASNLWFARRADDYFAPDAERNPVLHTWSLAVEEQFYFVWPFVIFLLFKGISRPDRRIAALVLLAVVSGAACVAITRSSQPWAFYAMPTRGWEFAIGAIARLASFRLADHLRSVLSAAGLALIVGAAVGLTRYTPYPGTLAALPVLGTAAIILGGTGASASVVTRLLSTAPMTWVGQRSYSIYLWHWPLLVFAELLTTSTSNRGLINFGCVAASIVAGDLSYRFVERPIRHSAFFKARRRTIGAALLVSLLCICAAAAALGLAARDAKLPAFREIARVENNLPDVYRDKCLGGATVRAANPCSFGSSTPRRTIAVWGDSHAAQWFPAVEALARKNEWQVITLLKSSCPASNVSIFDPRLGRISHECDQWRKASLGYLIERRPDLVITSGSYAYVVEANGDGESGPTAGAWIAGLASSLGRLDQAGVRVLHIGDTPISDVSVPVCLARAYQAGLSASLCDLPRPDGARRALMQGEISVISPLGSAAFVDPTALLCAARSCPARIGKLIGYRDRDHLSAAFAATLAASLEPAISRQLAEPVPHLRQDMRRGRQAEPRDAAEDQRDR